MKHNVIFIFIICLFLSNPDYGQKVQMLPEFVPQMDTTFTPQYQRHLTNYPSLPVYLGAYFSKYKYTGLENETFQKLCIEGGTYFKFTLTSDGILKDVVAIRGTPEFFVEIFKKGIMSSKNFWKFPKGISHSGLDLVLPFKYRCLLGCNRGLRDEHLNVKYFPNLDINSSKLQFEDGKLLSDIRFFLEPYQMDYSGDY